jgi:hypothetical protein
LVTVATAREMHHAFLRPPPSLPRSSSTCPTYATASIRRADSAWVRLIRKVYEADPYGGSCPLSRQREFPELPSLSQTHESHRRDHRPRAGPQDTPRSGSRLPELIPSQCPRGVIFPTVCLGPTGTRNPERSSCRKRRGSKCSDGPAAVRRAVLCPPICLIGGV